MDVSHFKRTYAILNVIMLFVCFSFQTSPKCPYWQISCLLWKTIVHVLSCSVTKLCKHWEWNIIWKCCVDTHCLALCLRLTVKSLKWKIRLQYECFWKCYFVYIGYISVIVKWAGHQLFFLPIYWSILIENNCWARPWYTVCHLKARSVSVTNI